MNDNEKTLEDWKLSHPAIVKAIQDQQLEAYKAKLKKAIQNSRDLDIEELIDTIKP